ncbi:unnamed protein product [Anisakis simplex]|uniref:Biogenesis of lysosome-related organelles complex 1 subunit 2 n=1 Tax=Anisakis simplex TaxID=6269 RepID=A0A0M3JUN1_ANISI|nr:unnamed protein product [Anisakis simplex]
MAQMINERASTSTDCPPTPAPTMVTSEMRQLADNMYDKVANYLQGQIEGTIAEYKLLEDMNTVTGQRYEDMKCVASGVAAKLTQLNEKCASLETVGFHCLLESEAKMKHYVRICNKLMKLMRVRDGWRKRQLYSINMLPHWVAFYHSNNRQNYVVYSSRVVDLMELFVRFESIVTVAIRCFIPSDSPRIHLFSHFSFIALLTSVI